jgi:hypothetical protein
MAINIDLEKFLDDVQRYSDSVKFDADNAASQLESLGSLPFVQWIGFAKNKLIETDKPEPITPSSELPVLEKSSFEWDNDFFNPDRFKMPQIDSQWFTDLEVILNNAIAEGDPNSVAIYDRLYSLLDSDDSWLSTDLRQAINTATKALVAKLTDDIQTGGTGISEEVQQALFDSLYERDNQAVNDELTKALAVSGKKGFPLMTDQSLAARDSVLARQDDNLKQRSRDILVRTSDLAQQNTQFAESALIQLAGLDQQTFFATMNGFTTLGEQQQQRLIQLIQAGSDMEKVKVDYSTGYARVFSDLSNALLTKFKVEQQARIDEFDGQMKTILANADIANLNAQLQQADNELITKQWEVDARNATEQTKALISQAVEATQVKLQAARSLSDFYRTLVSSSLSQVSTLVSTSGTD